MLGDDEEEEEEEEEAGIVFTNGEQLEMVVEYLRNIVKRIFVGTSIKRPGEISKIIMFNPYL